MIDFLNDLQQEQERGWRTVKIYVAAFRWFYSHVLQAKEFAHLIPYPKEKPSLPQVLSRDELGRLFDHCANKKHRMMFQLLYSSGLRRNELLHLKIEDIITDDGKYRIRINKGKGDKTATRCCQKNYCHNCVPITREVNLHILRHCFINQPLSLSINSNSLDLSRPISASLVPNFILASMLFLNHLIQSSKVSLMGVNSNPV